MENEISLMISTPGKLTIQAKLGKSGIRTVEKLWNGLSAVIQWSWVKSREKSVSAGGLCIIGLKKKILV